jgi:MFS family permease
MAGAAAAFVGVITFGLFQSPWLFFAGLFIWGAGAGHNWVMSSAEIQRVTPNHVLGRVTALDFLLMSSSQVIAVLLAAVMIDMTDAPQSGIWVSVGIGLCVWLLLIALYSRSPTIPTANQTQAEESRKPDKT